MKIENFIKETAEQLNLDEQIVEKVIKHQWRTANQALKTNSQIEISGIGYFETSRKRLKSQITRFQLLLGAYDRALVEETEAGQQKKVDTLNRKIRILKGKIDSLEYKLKLHENRLERIASGNLQQIPGGTMDEGSRREETEGTL